jgi:Na+-transporting NADH:ubiquinone oxidoreductase subunit A
MQRVVIKLTKGLDIPIEAPPEQTIQDAPAVGSVALLGVDYVGLRPSVVVREGEQVALGQPLFTDKNDPRVRYVSPGSGTVTAINRGTRRALLSIVITLEGDEELEFNAYQPGDISSLSEAQVKEELLASGLWTALRTRPFSRAPSPDARPDALFVNAMDSNPLAADPEVVVAQGQEDFLNGLRALGRLGETGLFLCKAADAEIPGGHLPGVQIAEFAGPHPAGLVGTHIHHLAPVTNGRTVWCINYQDVMAVGRLFTSGSLPVERVVALGGPVVKRPRLLRTRLGASLRDLTGQELEDVDCRVVSGSILSGRRAADALAYLGRYHLQVSVLAEGRQRHFLGWLAPGSRRFSASRAFLYSLLPKRLLPLTTSQNGSPRAMVPVGAYERVVPLDLLPTQLLRALVVGDTEMARQLGCLELDEEDLALCSFVCPSKYDFGSALREVLTRIEKEG